MAPCDASTWGDACPGGLAAIEAPWGVRAGCAFFAGSLLDGRPAIRAWPTPSTIGPASPFTTTRKAEPNTPNSHSHGRALRPVADRLLNVACAMLKSGTLFNPALAAPKTA